ncbi:WhiB family transcriptional regulator [Rhodococcus tibetensis]|uniref:WhiB family transcriptional regulator n=1 Tax=Rhodococcus tibetensis TaxID=2965064 RepID=UPI00272E352D
MLPVGPSSPPPAEEITHGDRDWREDAACRGIESSVFFSPDGERGHARDRREARARRICQDCPVLRRCRDHALAAGESYGIWGGMTETDRRRHAHRLRRGEHRPLTSRHPRPATSGTGDAAPPPVSARDEPGSPAPGGVHDDDAYADEVYEQLDALIDRLAPICHLVG